MLGITFQQVQKYENGRNRVSASRLVDIATVLDMPVGCFLPQHLADEDGQPDAVEAVRPPGADQHAHRRPPAGDRGAGVAEGWCAATTKP
jgi:transcriptional regulator with XRE-family HTH domain